MPVPDTPVSSVPEDVAAEGPMEEEASSPSTASLETDNEQQNPDDSNME